MDGIDRRILQALQEDASGSVADIAERAGVSQTPCWRRIKRLEQSGYITRRVAILDQDALNLALTAFVTLTVERADAKAAAAVSTIADKTPEIVEAHEMSGASDFMIKIVAPDMASYQAVHAKLVKLEGVSSVRADFAMERLKATTQLPLAYLSI